VAWGFAERMLSLASSEWDAGNGSNDDVDYSSPLTPAPIARVESLARFAAPAPILLAVTQSADGTQGRDSPAAQDGRPCVPSFRIPSAFTLNDERLVTTTTRFPRLHIEEAPPALADKQASLLDELRSSFERTTGWSLRKADAPRHRAANDDGRRANASPATRWIVDGRLAQRGGNDVLPLSHAEELAEGLSRLVEEWRDACEALRAREAELATCVSMTLRPEDAKAMSHRLEWVLKSGAGAVGCQAAGLYLLDPETTHLKLRASWGLPEKRLLDPPRSLQGATAELEALLGHAVVLEDARLLPHWQAPEDFPSAACVPVSSPTTPLGVLWVFCERQRDFSAAQTNLLEIVAGRLASDLERDVLLRATEANRKTRRAWERGVAWQESRSELPAPLTPGYEVAAIGSSAGELSGDFHDWLVRHDGQLAVMIGDAHGGALEAALSAAAAHGAARAHSSGALFAGELLALVNETIWSSSTGGQSASLASGFVEPELGTIELALCGETMAAVCQRGELRTLCPANEPAGANLELRPLAVRLALHPGDAIALLSGGARRAWEMSKAALDGESPLAPLAKNQWTAEQMANAILQAIEEAAQPLAEDDRTVLVLKRKAKKS
jgi:sigma-B regulation protein RsbU (phosphoserine phosphatase)